MNQEQKDTIREELRDKICSVRKGSMDDKQFKATIEHILDQAYQQGAKDKVEEVIKNWNKSNKKKNGSSEGMNRAWANFDDYIDTLKDNT